MKFIYVRGGSKRAPEVAKSAGAYYGIRSDYKPYDDVYMLDVDFHNFTPEEWPKYLEKVRKYRPTMALAPDYGELKKHTVTRSELYSYLHDLIVSNVPEILVCPKFPSAISHIPVSNHIIVAISVPARNYAGFVPPDSDLKSLNSRRIHLLGGNPKRQAELICKLQGVGAIIHSVDGSYLALKAGFGQYFEGGRWVQTEKKQYKNVELEKISLKNIMKYLESYLSNGGGGCENN